ncbi:MAG: P1 family peptidase [Proteobacteria bacterium]|nr:P1 family peptidase [Pseudomonadota bacterium]
MDLPPARPEGFVGLSPALRYEALNLNRLVCFIVCGSLMPFLPDPATASSQTPAAAQGSQPTNSPQRRSVKRVRARALGIAPGIFAPGPHNAITDVRGVHVGHYTLHRGADLRTGATAILPHAGNIYQSKVPAAAVVGNGYGKLMGFTQIEELGEIETPIVLTNTLAVPRAADALLDWTLSQPGNEEVRSVNTVVGETNDGVLNDIRSRVLTPQAIAKALRSASDGPVLEGSVGAGTGTRCYGFKGGIGTSSRVLPRSLGAFRLGVLVQTNHGGVLQIDGVPIGKLLGSYYLKDAVESDIADGSIMIVIATDAPLSDRNLKRLARRALAGLARTGSSMTNGSGDYAIAFSTATSVRRTPDRRQKPARVQELPNSRVSPLFQATIEATEEAIYNSLFMATTTRRRDSRTGRSVTAEALPLSEVRRLLRELRPTRQR